MLTLVRRGTVSPCLPSPSELRDTRTLTHTVTRFPEEKNLSVPKHRLLSRPCSWHPAPRAAIPGQTPSKRGPHLCHHPPPKHKSSVPGAAPAPLPKPVLL